MKRIFGAMKRKEEIWMIDGYTLAPGQTCVNKQTCFDVRPTRPRPTPKYFAQSPPRHNTPPSSPRAPQTLKKRAKSPAALAQSPSAKNSRSRQPPVTQARSNRDDAKGCRRVNIPAAG